MGKNFCITGADVNTFKIYYVVRKLLSILLCSFGCRLIIGVFQDLMYLAGMTVGTEDVFRTFHVISYYPAAFISNGDHVVIRTACSACADYLCYSH